MVSCGVTTVKAFATIRLGDLKVSTPYILNINVSRSRGQLVSNASVTFNVLGEFRGTSGAPLVIYFYNELVFTGVAKRISVGPSAKCAGELIVRIQGEDIMHRLEGKNITRRQKLPGLGPIAFISSLNKRTTVGFDDPPSRHDISNSSSPVEAFVPTVNMRDQTQFLNNIQDTSGALHPVTKNADPIVSAGTAQGGGGFILHDHTSLDLSGPHAGGPARAVFGIK